MVLSRLPAGLKVQVVGGLTSRSKPCPFPVRAVRV